MTVQRRLGRSNVWRSRTKIQEPSEEGIQRRELLVADILKNDACKIFAGFRISKSREIERRLVNARGSGGGRMGTYYKWLQSFFMG